jgi:hypothetical protein
MTRDDFDFPNCMHAMSAGLHMCGINPQNVTISLPHPEWWRLYCALERKFGSLMQFDGRGEEPGQFQYMGFIFRAALTAEQRK